MGIVKKAIAIIAIILMILASSVTIAVTEQKGKVATDTLRLRKEASLESTVLELLYKDNEVEIVGEEGDWYKVKYKTYTGYVSKEFVKTESQNATEANSTEPTKEENTNNENNNQNTENENNNQENENNNNQSVENNNNQTTPNNTSNVQKGLVSSDLDIRILPLINSSVIGKFNANTNVELVSVTGVWTYVKNNELAGWARLDKISVVNENTQTNNQVAATQPENNTVANIQNTENNNTTENNQTSNTVAENTSEKTNNNTDSQTTMYSSAKTYYVNSSAVNVREKSNTDSSVVKTVSRNTEIKVVGEESNWYKVEVSGKTGYILKSLLSTEKIEVTNRSTTQERNEDSKKTTSEDKKEEKTSAKSSESSTSKGNEVIAYAKKYLGCRYVYGGSGPSTFDCSGFTMYVYKHFGYSLPHNAVTQAKVGKYVAKSDLQPGDLIIFNNSANTSIGHVGMYVGGGSFIHASSGSGKIIISSLSGSYYKARYVTARRLV